MTPFDEGSIYHPWKLCRWLYGGAWKWGLWFRLFGYGPHIERDRMALFSERYGYRKVYRLGRWSFEWIDIRPVSTSTKA